MPTQRASYRLLAHCVGQTQAERSATTHLAGPFDMPKPRIRKRLLSWELRRPGPPAGAFLCHSLRSRTLETCPSHRRVRNADGGRPGFQTRATAQAGVRTFSARGRAGATQVSTARRARPSSLSEAAGTERLKSTKQRCWSACCNGVQQYFESNGLVSQADTEAARRSQESCGCRHDDDGAARRIRVPPARR